MKRKRFQPFLLIPLLLIFVFSWTQAGETVLCVSDSQTHYVKKNPLRMMTCHAVPGDRSRSSHNPHRGTQAVNPDTSACTEILLASANSLRQPEDEKLKTAVAPPHSWAPADISPYPLPAPRGAENAYFRKNQRDTALRALRTTILLI